ncbi:hypothetical protein QJS66_11525 [Kocuria rhizophila]|nr:hypothetical protein QJS66_11525 [Kocuria rhizophila]
MTHHRRRLATFAGRGWTRAAAPSSARRGPSRAAAALLLRAVLRAHAHPARVRAHRSGGPDPSNDVRIDGRQAQPGRELVDRRRRVAAQPSCHAPARTCTPQGAMRRARGSHRAGRPRVRVQRAHHRDGARSPLRAYGPAA